MTGPTSLRLGERKKRKPKGTPRLKPINVIRFTHELAHDNPVFFDQIRARVDHLEGRPRTLDVVTLVGAGFAAALDGQVHVTAIASVLAELEPPDQRVLGVRWTDPNRGGEKVITARQVEYLFTQIAHAFDPHRVGHDHPIEADGFVLAPGGDGVILGTIDDLRGDEHGDLACTPACPRWMTTERLGNILLAALHDHLGITDTGRYAIDSYLLETHYRTRSWGSKDKIDHDQQDHTPTPSNHDTPGHAATSTPGRAGTTRARHAGRARRTGAKRCRRTRKGTPRAIAPVGPTAAGDFTRADPAFPQIRPNGRLAHTKDHGAGNGFQGASGSRHSGIKNGRDKHTLVQCGLLPDGTPIPPFQRAYACVPAGDDKAAPNLAVLDYAADTGLAPGLLAEDRGYTMLQATAAEQPVRARGWALVKDLAEYQRTDELHAPGVRYLDGWYYTTGIQPGLTTLPRPPQNASSEVRAASQARFDTRIPYAFRSNGTTTAGNLRLRGPAVPDAVTRNPATGKPTGVRGVRVRCVNSPYVHLLPLTLPQTTCVKGVTCGCSMTLTIPADQVPNSIEPKIWGSSRWAKDYYRRNLVETNNSIEQHHQRIGAKSIFVRAGKWDLAHLLLNAATLLVTFHNWIMRLGAHGLDHGEHHTLMREVITACLAAVGVTPTWAHTTSPPRDDSGPPGS